MTLKEELLEYLQEYGISPEQIALVDECIDKDELDKFKGSFVPKVGWAEFEKKVSKDYNEFDEELNEVVNYMRKKLDRSMVRRSISLSLKKIKLMAGFDISEKPTYSAYKVARIAMDIYETLPERFDLNQLERWILVMIAFKLSMQIVDNTTFDEEESWRATLSLYSFENGEEFFDEFFDEYLDEAKKHLSDEELSEVELVKLEFEDVIEKLKLPSGIDLKRSSIQYMIETDLLSSEDEHPGNWKWWVLIQWWAKLNSSLGILDIGYSDTEDGVMPRRLSPTDKQWINKEFGEIYTKKDEDVIKTVLARNPEWKSLYLYIDNEKDELVKLCEELDQVFL
ncbi:MAG: hypothetical protein IKV15_03110 [Bacteroidaceae bacterium]|nr:hypothetical protein [Bacteroidaceae bacterium]